LRDEGRNDEAMELEKTRPFPAFMAKILMEKLIGVRTSCGLAAGIWQMRRPNMEKTGLTIGMLYRAAHGG
jgi:hypothetical protein